ncbi:MAG TPA: gephyrin-like molybdotransferase Glp [Vicinamibacterales bacterium]|nr:gephyrin-like molybdotransferase Glp [Vicinamibacterales bacterium]
MRPITETLLFDDAMQVVMKAATPITRAEQVALIDADGRVAARDVVAAVDVPPFDRAAMDGYAVVAEDTFGASTHASKTLACVDRVFTGQVPARGIRSGECIEIATGAPMPAGADAVVMVEETERDGDDSSVVRVLTPVYPRQNVGRRGADISTGQTVVARDQVLNPSRIGALAATGVTMVEVFARPSVAILSTGNEIVTPGQPLGPGQIYDVNRFTLETIVNRHGGRTVILPTAADTIDELSDALTEAQTHDVVVFSGGSSVGDRDLILDALKQRGEILFHGVAVKPGKPTVFGRVGRTPVFGMPGYPTSCLSNAYMMIVPFLRQIARLPRWEPPSVEVPLARRIVSTTGRHQFYTVRLVDGRAEPAFKASGDITSMAHADGYIEIPAQTDVVEAGTTVTVKLF